MVVLGSIVEPRQHLQGAVTGAGAALLMQACGGGDDAHAQGATLPDPILGLWQSSVTLADCASGATIGSFGGLTSFNQGDTASADNNQSSDTKGPALGFWNRGATGTYTVDLRFWRYDASGAPPASSA